MVKGVEKLTDTQVSRLSEWRERWLTVGLSTDPTDWDGALAGIHAAYLSASLEPPRIVIRLSSPMAGAIGAAMLSVFPKGLQVGSQVRGQVGDQVRDQVWDQVRGQVRGRVWDQVRVQVWGQVGDRVLDQVWDRVLDQVRGQVWGQVGDRVLAKVGSQVGDRVWVQVGKACYGLHDAGWLAFYHYFREVCSLESCARLDGLVRTAESCGWWWPFRGAVIITERPARLCRDTEFRLHCEDGPAIAWSDGWAIYAWHGVCVTEQIIMRSDTLTVDQIEAEKNAEVRRVMLSRFGEARYLEESGAELVAEDEFGQLYRREIPDDEPLLMVRVLNSTPEPDGRIKPYWLRVAPDCRPLVPGSSTRPQALTALNAVASTFGMTGSEYLQHLVAQS